MKHLFVYLMVGLVFMLLQTTLLPRLLPLSLMPNLLLILVLYLGLSETFGRALLLCLILGLLQDSFSSNPRQEQAAFLIGRTSKLSTTCLTTYCGRSDTGIKQAQKEQGQGQQAY